MKAASTLLACALLAAGVSSAAAAQQSSKVHRIGVLGVASATTYARQVEALRRGFSELGYVEGKNLAIDFRWADHDPGRLPTLATELVRTNPDVIVTSGPGTAVLKRTTSTIPIVMAVSTNAAEAGLVASLARPGGNITGSSSFAREFMLKRVELLKEALPRLEHIGLLVHANSPGNARNIEALRDAARSINARLRVIEVSATTELADAFSSFAKDRTEAVIVGESTVLVAAAAQIAQFANANRLPSIGFVELAEVGGLMAYGADFPALWHRAATFVDRILKGMKPSELPVEQPMKFEFVFNRRTAKALGLQVPQSILLRADRVIE